MKSIRKISFIILFLALAFSVTSCSGKDSTTVEGTIESVTPQRDSISVSVKLQSSNFDNAVFYLNLYESDDTNTVIQSLDLVSEDKQQDVTFDSSKIKSSTKYQLVLYGTYNKTKKEIVKKDVETTNLGLKENPKEISTVADFYAMKDDNHAFFKLTKDLDFSSEENFTPIFNSSTPFYGALDGNGKTLKNIKLTKNTTYSSIFGYLKGATISNLNVDNVTADVARASTLYFGVVASYITGYDNPSTDYKVASLENVNVTNAKLVVESQGTTSDAFIGGMIGKMANGSKLLNSSIKGSIEYTAKYKGNLGGLVGVAGDNSGIGALRPSIDNSTADMDMKYTLNNTSSTAYDLLERAGGIAGTIKTADISNCAAKINMTVSLSIRSDLDTSKVSYNMYAGGLVGYVVNSTVKNSVASLTLDASSISCLDFYAGGLAGYLSDNFGGLYACLAKGVVFKSSFTAPLDEMNDKLQSEATEENPAEPLVANIHFNESVARVKDVDLSDVLKASAYFNDDKVYAYSTATYTKKIRTEGEKEYQDLSVKDNAMISTNIGELSLSDTVLSFLNLK